MLLTTSTKKNRNKVKGVTVKLAQEEQHKISPECKRNPKKFWQYINKKTTSKTGIGVKYDLRKFGFTNRVVSTWNSLPNWVVSANTTNTFKTRLDKFWHNQDIIYNFRAQLQGTGRRSQFLYEES